MAITRGGKIGGRGRGRCKGKGQSVQKDRADKVAWAENKVGVEHNSVSHLCCQL